jgi:thiol-disulfide isomerase/thioredoxin
MSLVPLTGDSQSVDLTELSGKIVLINYWGTWCPPCLIEFPHIVELEKKYRNRPGFRLLSVSSGIGPEEDLNRLELDTQEHLDRYEAELPTYADPQGFSRQSLMFTADMSSFGLPTTVLIDGQATIRALWMGSGRGVEDEMDQLIDQLLRESDRRST